MKSKVKVVVRAKKGDKEAFQELIHAEKEKLYKMAYVYMRNEVEALDVFQETVYQALVSISSLQKNEYFSSWITRILINNAISSLRKKQKVVPMTNEFIEHVGQHAEMQIEDRLDLLDALENLEERYKTVLLLRFYNDFTVKQISTVLNDPEGTVKTNIHRGLQALRTKIKGVYHEDKRNSFI